MKHYSFISKLFCYPTTLSTEDFSVLKNLSGNYPSAFVFLNSFEKKFFDLNFEEREEYFIKTFDVQAISTMDLGYILFGEDYKRGDFLAKMQFEQNKVGNITGSELADHLPNVLNLLPLLEQDTRNELAFILIIPAVREIIRKFEQTSNFYLFAFQFLLSVLENDFRDLPYEQYVITQDKNEGVSLEYQCGGNFINQMVKQKF